MRMAGSAQTMSPILPILKMHRRLAAGGRVRGHSANAARESNAFMVRYDKATDLAANLPLRDEPGVVSVRTAAAVGGLCACSRKTMLAHPRSPRVWPTAA